MTNAVFLDLQNPADFERVYVSGLCGKISPASSLDAYQAISVKVEVPSETQAEEDPLTTTFPGGLKSEPEVSCVSVSMLGRFQ
jgi:hypothetical protein